MLEIIPLRKQSNTLAYSFPPNLLTCRVFFQPKNTMLVSKTKTPLIPVCSYANFLYSIFSNINTTKLIFFVVTYSLCVCFPNNVSLNLCRGVIGESRHRVTSWQKDKFVDKLCWHWVMGRKIVCSHYLFRKGMHVHLNHL